MSLRPPGGAPPPGSVELAGQRFDLIEAAGEVCRRYYAEYPDEDERYGAAGRDWCRHDNQWLLCWAVNDVLGATDLDEQVRWLARVLGARDFPLSRLARNLEIAAESMADGPFGPASAAVGARLDAAAATVSSLSL